MVFACKKCKKCFRRNIGEFEDESAEYCPHCDNHFLLKAVSKESSLGKDWVPTPPTEILDFRLSQKDWLVDMSERLG